jgi:hypothetical protein
LISAGQLEILGRFILRTELSDLFAIIEHERRLGWMRKDIRMTRRAKFQSKFRRRWSKKILYRVLNRFHKRLARRQGLLLDPKFVVKRAKNILFKRPFSQVIQMYMSFGQRRLLQRKLWGPFIKGFYSKFQLIKLPSEFKKTTRELEEYFSQPDIISFLTRSW